MTNKFVTKLRHNGLYIREWNFQCLIYKQNGVFLFCFPFPWRHSFTLVLYIGLLKTENNMYFFLLSRFTNLGISSVHIWQYTRGPFNCWEFRLLLKKQKQKNTADMLSSFYVKILSGELVLILIVVIWLHSSATFCNFLPPPPPFIMVLMVQTYSNSTIEWTFKQTDSL